MDTQDIDADGLFFYFLLLLFLTPFLAILNLKTQFLGHFDGRPKGPTPDSNYPRGTLGGHKKKSTKNDKNNTPPPHLPHCDLFNQYQTYLVRLPPGPKL